MEDYNAAFNAYDADALEALVADIYRIYGPEAGSIDLDMEGVRNNLMPQFAGWDWQITSPGPVYAVSDGGILWYVSTEGATITRSGPRPHSEWRLDGCRQQRRIPRRASTS